MGVLDTHHLQRDKDTGTDLRNLISIAQLELGLTTPILENVELYLPHLEPGHIQHLRDRLKTLDEKILIRDNVCVQWKAYY